MRNKILSFRDRLELLVIFANSMKRNSFSPFYYLLTANVNVITLAVKEGIHASVNAKFVPRSLKKLVLAAAKELFLTRGYDAVGMRDIASAVGRQPVQIYRLNLSKPDILAELIIELNAEEIRQLPELLKKISGNSLNERVCAYFLELYRLDIEYLAIRSVGAAFGWMWNARYEQQIIGQVFQLLQPVAEWMAEAGLGNIEARGYGIWSVYYVGFRRAAIHGGSAEECIAEIRPTLELLLQQTTTRIEQISSEQGGEK